MVIAGFLNHQQYEICVLHIPPWWQSLATHRFPIMDRCFSEYNNSKMQATHLWSTNSQGGNLNLHVCGNHLRKVSSGARPPNHHPPLAELASVPAKLFHPNVLRWKMMGGKVGEPLSDEFYQTNEKKIRHCNVHLTHYTPPQSLMDASCRSWSKKIWKVRSCSASWGKKAMIQRLATSRNRPYLQKQLLLLLKDK